MTTRRFCFIPAKSTSQRLSGKNLRLLDGKELIYYPITCAKESGLFLDQDVVVSSEDDRTRQLASDYGANVSYRRPDALARDPYGVKDVLIDYLTHHPEHSDYDEVCMLLPTAPLVIPDDIRNAAQLFESGEFGSVISVCETDHNALRSVYIEENLIRPIHPDCLGRRTQELPFTYRINGAVVFISVRNLLEHGSFFVDPLGGYLMPQERSIDIDTELDLKLAEFMISLRDR